VFGVNMFGVNMCLALKQGGQDEKNHNQHSVDNQNSTLGFRRALNENLQRCTKLPRHMNALYVIIDSKNGKYFLEMF
jgi:hypothetical protein